MKKQENVSENKYCLHIFPCQVFNLKNIIKIVFKMLIQYERKKFCDVTDCPINRNLPSPFLHVKNDTANFGSIGEFTCDNSGTLFFTNGTLVSSNYTTCLATAEWARQNYINVGKVGFVQFLLSC